MNNDNNNRYSTYKENIVKGIYTYIHSNTCIHIHITEIRCFIVSYLIGGMNTQAYYGLDSITHEEFLKIFLKHCIYMYIARQLYQKKGQFEKKHSFIVTIDAFWCLF